MAEHLKMTNDVLQTRLNVVYKELQDAQSKLGEYKTLLAAKDKPRQSLWQRFIAWASEKTDYTGPK
jgi:hypothetical protein